MKKIISLVCILALSACGLRTKQALAVVAVVATYPAAEAVDRFGSDDHALAWNVGYAAVVTGLLVTAVVLLELDLRRDMTGERVTLRVGGKRPLAGSYVQEVCNHRVMLCLGPYRSFAIRSVRPTQVVVPNDIGHTEHYDAWLLGAEVVASIPPGAVVHELEADCPACRDADARAWEEIAPEFDGEDDHDVDGTGVLGR